MDSMKRFRLTLQTIATLLGFAFPTLANDRPASNQQVQRPAAAVSLSDGAITSLFFDSDVMLVIDNSTMGVLASGIDVDGDGVVGRNLSAAREWRPSPPSSRFWTTDPGDTLEALQLKIAEPLVERLAARNNRVGLTSTTFRARTDGTSVVRLTEKPGVTVPIGDPSATLEALQEFPRTRERRRTDLTRLLERSAKLLEDATPNSESRRPRMILLLSHGVPSAPNGIQQSSTKAIKFADGLEARGIELWAVSLRANDVAFLSQLTEAGGGSVLALDQLDARFGVHDSSASGSGSAH